MYSDTLFDIPSSGPSPISASPSRGRASPTKLSRRNSAKHADVSPIEPAFAPIPSPQTTPLKSKGSWSRANKRNSAMSMDIDMFTVNSASGSMMPPPASPSRSKGGISKASRRNSAMSTDIDMSGLEAASSSMPPPASPHKSKGSISNGRGHVSAMDIDMSAVNPASAPTPPPTNRHKSQGSISKGSWRKNSMHIDTSRPAATSSSSLPSSSPSPSPSPSPSMRRAPPAPPQGIEPAALVGATIVRIARSAAHPAATLHTADGRAFQVRVDGYDPAHARMPRALETASALFAPGERAVHLTVRDCRHVALKDTAMAQGKSGEVSRWSVEHLALAFRFEEEGGWQCLWATMADYEEEKGPCTYRTFDDVYLDELKARKRKPDAN